MKPTEKPCEHCQKTKSEWTLVNKAEEDLRLFSAKSPVILKPKTRRRFCEPCMQLGVWDLLLKSATVIFAMTAGTKIEVRGTNVQLF